MAERGTPVTPESFQTLGSLMSFLRERARLTQRDLAARVNYHYSYISRVEKNQHTPNVPTLIGRFIPALEIQDEPQWMKRLVELASTDAGKLVASKQAEATVPEIKAYRPPSSLTSMLGRERESEQVIEILLRDSVRMLTIVGPPGVGKTRLSLHVAEQLIKQFAHGAVFVNLASVPHFAMVLASLAEALGVQESPESSLQITLEAFLQSKQLLILFDNFEQVLPAAPALIGLLHRSPKVKMLVTSREALRAPGEHEFHLAPLPLPDDPGSIGKGLGDSPAIQLFAQRACAVQPGFQLTDENASRVAEICRRLDGLPLAIELAASRIQTLSLNTMLNQFEKRFSWLTRGRSDIPEWRQTLSGAIAWSYQLLSEPERILLHRLSIFEGGWTLDAAENICSDETTCPSTEIFNLILHLADRSLVVVEQKDDETRYHYLATIRHFAHEKLTRSEEYERVNDRHLAYYTGWSEQMKEIINKVHPVEFRRMIEAENASLRAALNWSLGREQEIERGLRLAYAVCSVWMKLSYFKDALEWVQIFLPHTTGVRREHHRARLLYLKCALNYWRDQISLALESGLEAESLARGLDDGVLLADILYYLGGGIYKDMRELEKAYRYIKESIALCRETRHDSRLSIALTDLGTIFFQQGRNEEANQIINEALLIATNENDLWGQNFALRAHADHLLSEKRFEEALPALQRALEISLSIEDRISAGMKLANMALIANVLGDFTISEKYAKSALSIFQTIGNEYQQPFPLRMMAYSAIQAGKVEEARSYATESLQGNRRIEHLTGVLACLTAFAEIELVERKLPSAARLYAFVKGQIQSHSLELMDPDVIALKRVETGIQKKYKGKDQLQIQKDIEGIKLDDVIRELISAN